MSLTLPSELVWVLDLLGYSWPEADEQALHDVAEAWRAFGKDLETIQTDGDGFARTILASNAGTAVDEFTKGYYTGRLRALAVVLVAAATFAISRV